MTVTDIDEIRIDSKSKLTSYARSYADMLSLLFISSRLVYNNFENGSVSLRKTINNLIEFKKKVIYDWEANIETSALTTPLTHEEIGSSLVLDMQSTKNVFEIDWLLICRDLFAIDLISNAMLNKRKFYQIVNNVGSETDKDGVYIQRRKRNGGTYLHLIERSGKVHPEGFCSMRDFYKACLKPAKNNQNEKDYVEITEWVLNANKTLQWIESMFVNLKKDIQLVSVMDKDQVNSSTKHLTLEWVFHTLRSIQHALGYYRRELEKNIVEVSKTEFNTYKQTGYITFDAQ